MYGSSSNKQAYLFIQPFFARLHEGPRKGHEIPLRVVVDIDCDGWVARTKILPANAHIR